jgi:hypothetical protein
VLRCLSAIRLEPSMLRRNGDPLGTLTRNANAFSCSNAEACDQAGGCSRTRNTHRPEAEELSRKGCLYDTADNISCPLSDGHHAKSAALGIFLSHAREGGRKPGQFGRSAAAADQLR